MALPALKSSDLIFLGLYKRLLESIREHSFHCPKPPVMQSLLFQMHFIFSDEVVLLFDSWSVHSPAGKNWEALYLQAVGTWVLVIVILGGQFSDPDSSCINIERELCIYNSIWNHCPSDCKGLCYLTDAHKGPERG